MVDFSLRSGTGDLLVVLLLVIVAGCCYVAYIIGMQLYTAVQDMMSNNKRFSFDEKGVNIKVKHRTRDSTLDSAQRKAYKLFENSKAPDHYNGMFKYRQKADKRKLDHSLATAGVNSGWA